MDDSGIHEQASQRTSMQNNPITTTLLHTILKNQHAITDALVKIADWVEVAENNDAKAVAHSVRRSLKGVDDSRIILGQCISEIMRASGIEREEPPFTR
jgi:hypothetical protein